MAEQTPWPRYMFRVLGAMFFGRLCGGSLDFCKKSAWVAGNRDQVLAVPCSFEPIVKLQEKNLRRVNLDRP